MVVRAVLLLSILFTSTPAWAYDEERHAEYLRLHESLTNLSQRLQWTGVERIYDEMLEKELPMIVDDHLMAADAARAMGDMGQLEIRYERALAEWPNIELTQKLAEIKRNYGQVRLYAKQKEADLTPDERPFQPDLAAVIDRAQEILEDSGRYEGVLPVGSYTLVNETFRVSVLQQRMVVNARQGTLPEDPIGPDNGGGGGGGNGAKIAMFGGAGALAVGAGAMLGMAMQKKAYYYSDDIMYQELDETAQQANTFATASMALGGVAVGVGVGAVFVVDF